MKGQARRLSHYSSFLEARAGCVADFFADGAVIHAHGGLRAVAPDMAGGGLFDFFFRKSLLGRFAKVN